MSPPASNLLRMTGLRWPAAGVLFVCTLLALPGSRSLPRAADLEQGKDAVLLEENLDIEIVSETLARVRYSNRTKVLTGKGVAEHDVASIFYNPSVTIREFHADVIPPDVGAVSDVVALLRLAARNGFLVAALLGLARTAVSPYRKLRSTLGIAQYTEAEFTRALTAAGFTAERLPRNMEHNPARMTFRARLA